MHLRFAQLLADDVPDVLLSFFIETLFLSFFKLLYFLEHNRVHFFSEIKGALPGILPGLLGALSFQLLFAGSRAAVFGLIASDGNWRGFLGRV